METDNNSKNEINNEWHDNPDNWIMGIFYYNKNDKRIFPPKRLKYFGWTVNFANPYTALILAAIIIIVVVAAEFTN